jgi:CDP-diacylglycerol--serine O-phosphatidyltransferase
VFLLPSLMTVANLFCGYACVVYATRGDFDTAAVLIGIAMVLDTLDGFLARLTNSSSAFGVELDSLADVVSFGVAPALMLYFGVLHGIPVVGLAVCVGFVLCGAWRLARFALIADDRRFIGLPIPPAAVIAAGGAAWAPPAGIALALTVTLCALMVSDIPFPTLRTIGRLLTPRRAAEEESPATVLEVELDRTALSGSTSSPQRG